MKKLLLLMLAAAQLWGAEETLLPVGPDDVAPRQAHKVAVSMPDMPMSHELVRFEWVLEEGSQVALGSQVHKAESRGYTLHVRAGALSKGVVLPISAPGSLVRIDALTSIKGKTTQLPLAENLVLVDGAQAFHSEYAGLEKVIEALELEQNKNAFIGDAVFFKLGSEVALGTALLIAEGMDPKADGMLSIQVLEKNSEVVLSMQSRRDTYLPGERLVLEPSMTFNGKRMVLQQMEGILVAPSGRAIPLTVEKGRAVAVIEQDGDFFQPGLLWEARLTAVSDVDGLTVRRDVKTAFALSLPTAIVDGGRAQVDKGLLRAEVDLTVAEKGRYELRGVLFATDETGQLVAYSAAHAADLLSEGAARLDLEFNVDHLVTAGLSAPFELRNLQLIRQDKLSLIHRQATAFRVENP